MNQIKDYIIINISSEMSSDEIKEIVQNAIQKIKKETTIFQFLFNLNYYFIFSYFSFFFNKLFIVNSLIVTHNNVSYLIKKPLNLFVTDHGIKLHTFFIPYENITTFSSNAGIVELNILGSIADAEECLKVVLENDKQTTFSLNCKNGNYLVSLIKKNMYYHIRYNKINTDVINYYKTTQIKN
jgi:hypothetical protein